MLRLTSIDASYGRVQALRRISLHVGAGEIVSLIGANGAGKSTTLEVISGLIRPDSGRIVLGEQDVTSWRPGRLVRAGIAHVPEGRQVFGSLSVEDNLLLGAYSRTRSSREEIAADLQAQYKRFPRLHERRRQLAGSLSGGEQQMLALARGLMSRPKLLMLDEPSLGLAPIIAHQVLAEVKRLRDEGLTVLLVEQNARAALRIADRGYVVETGRIVLEGTAQDLLDNPEVQRAYLGRAYGEIWE
ncbi:MAG TPA: branched-chain amino acid ABC transporter ATP-binding protein [Armatimonadetes bacterium]|nr:branched-chain amino acid ABC transporter ATP-binding protein [Armatimonadota bacterium]